jgi:formylglycine-generating enzyme required for sulfatase activity
LPSVWETLSVWWFVPSRKQTVIQQLMMRKAKRVHVARWGSGLIALMLIGFGVWAGLATLRANNLKTQVKATVDLLPNSRGLAIPLILRDLARFPQGYVTTQLNERYANAPAEGKQSLAYALAEFGRADIDYLCNCIEAAFADEVDNLVHGLANSRVAALNQLKRLNDTATAAENWQLKARLAIIALKLGEETFAAEMCQIADRPDPIQRTIFINVLGEWHGELAPITHYFKGECGPALRSGLMLGIGTMAASALPNAELAEITTDIKQLYVTASESIVHSAAGWILRQWKEVEPTLTGVDQPAVDRDWFVNQQQMTMVKIESGHFVRQTLPYFVLQRITKSKNVVKHVETVSIKKSFYLSDREVTVGQFEAFRRDCMVAEQVEGNPFMSVAAKMMQDRSDFLIQKGLQDYNHLGEGHKLRGANIPVVNVSWEDSIVFCNWLSQQHRGKPCYSKIGDKEWEMDLSTDGYRLPTDAEWEYACRAGTTTEYRFGSDSQHLKKYAVLQTDSPFPGGSARPNGWGLFDMNGNVWEWRHEIFGDTLVERAFAVFPAESRIYGVFRGGSYNDSKSFCRSESTRKDRLDFRRDVLGFRVVFVSSSE